MISSSLRVLQVNLNRSQISTETTLQLAIELKVDIILVQEPWLVQGDWAKTRSIAHPAFKQIFPNNPLALRPRILAYISKSLKPSTTISPSSPNDPDVLIIDTIEGGSRVSFLNIYNEKGLGANNSKTLERVLYPLSETIDFNSTVIVGDFNTHHPFWDPLSNASPGAEDLINWMEYYDLSLVNTPGETTFFRPHMNRETVLDLTFSSYDLINRVKGWQTILESGSDHHAILFEITGTGTSLVPNPVHSTRFNTKIANWDLFTAKAVEYGTSWEVLHGPKLRELAENNSASQLVLSDDLATRTQLDQIANTFNDIVAKSARAAIPVSTPGAKAKPWWTDELKKLRQEMLRAQRKLKASLAADLEISEKRHYLQTRNTFFLEVKRAKRNHWNEFLSNEDPKTIFKAMAYAKEDRIEPIPPISLNGTLQASFTGKCKAFRNTLFPKPPVTSAPTWHGYRPSNRWKWPNLSKIELKNACSGAIKGKTPGPDSITQEIIRHAYEAIPDIFHTLYSSLLRIGYHPACWKEATGAILKKPKKLDYSIPKAYRVISLLNCLGKVSERIIAQRLSYLAETTNLLFPTQIGGRQKKSAIDAAFLLTTEVEKNKREGRKSSAVFLDVKGAFDHVSKNRLLDSLKELELPLCLIAWLFAFLSHRRLRLSFDGQTQEFTDHHAGIAQGSPVSPILFLIYARNLFPTLAVKNWSYIDDIALVTSSTSLRKNIKVLESEIAKLYELGAQNAIEFDLEKTELIHFYTGKASRDTNLILPNNEVVKPKALVRWLGIWFDQSLSFKEHVSIRISQAKQAFLRLARLANSERGLTPFAFRQLYRACIDSVADYGSPIWWKGQASLARRMQALQNLGLRKILGTWKTTPIAPMEVEAALAPPAIRLNTNARRYALRIAKLQLTHPIRQELTNLQTIKSRSNILSDDFWLSDDSDRPQLPHIQLKPTQLELLHSRIQGLVDFSTLEIIQHFHFPPWDLKTPYTVQISNQTKEDEAKSHDQLIKSLAGSNTLAIYTDGSQTQGGKGIGIGIAVIDLSTDQVNLLSYEKSVNIGSDQIVYNGELEGIVLAIEYASEKAKRGQKVLIFSDNQAALLRLKTLSDNPGQDCQIRAIKATQRALRKYATIELVWVPGHTDLFGNEAADQLAKHGTKLPASSTKTSFAILGIKIKQLAREEWAEYVTSYATKLKSNNQATYCRVYPWIISSKLRIPTGIKREIASTLFQLKFGHGYFKDFLFRIKHATTPYCVCDKREKPEHLLLNCAQFREARPRLADKLRSYRLSMRQLLHTKEGIEATIGFLQETGLGTRKWHLARHEEEESEEEEESGEGGSEGESSGRGESGVEEG
jgi:ribonuclease HI